MPSQRAATTSFLGFRCCLSLTGEEEGWTSGRLAPRTAVVIDDESNSHYLLPCLVSKLSCRSLSPRSLDTTTTTTDIRRDRSSIVGSSLSRYLSGRACVPSPRTTECVSLSLFPLHLDPERKRQKVEATGPSA